MLMIIMLSISLLGTKKYLMHCKRCSLARWIDPNPLHKCASYLWNILQQGLSVYIPDKRSTFLVDRRRRAEHGRAPSACNSKPRWTILKPGNPEIVYK